MSLPLSSASFSSLTSPTTRIELVLTSPVYKVILLTIVTGFMAVAQLPVVFLFAMKNSVLSLLLGPGHGYERLNIIHRWSGRVLFLSATIHGTMWIHQHLQYNIPILGQQKETSGIASFSLLCILVLTSLRPVRRLFYQGFFMVQ